MKFSSKFLSTFGLLLITPLITSAQFGMPGGSSDDGAKWIGLNPAVCTAPIPFFDDFDDGFVVLRDGSRLDGKINIKDYEKSGEKINITTKDGKKYKLYTYSIKYFGLNINIPRNRSPLNLFDWKNEKRKATKDFERGFVVLMTGDTLDGKIKIEGRSSESPRAEGNFFAIETLSFQDKSGKVTEYTRDKIKSFGRILPWELSPNEMWQWSSSEAFGKRKSKAQPGFIIMNDGSRVEGDVRLVIRNSMSGASSPSNDRFGGPEKPRSKIYNDLVDEIWVMRDGKDLKISMDDVYAFGVANMTINTLTNKGTRLYQLEEMNFHTGSVTTRDGKKREGFVALRPYDKNYYGIYFAKTADEPIEIIPMKDITALTQDIELIEAFGEEAMAPRANTNINGYIVQADGSRFEGTIKPEGDNGWWVKSIEFIDKESRSIRFGDTFEPIAYFVMNDVMYVQQETVFIKADQLGTPYTLYSDPYPKSSGLGTFAMGLASFAVGEAVGMAVADAQRGGLDLDGVEMNGQDLGGATTTMSSTIGNTTITGTGMVRTNAQNIIGGSVSGMMFKGLQDDTEKKKRKEGPKKDDKNFYLYNAATRESRKADDLAYEVLLEGCLEFHALPKAEQKIYLSGGKPAVDYLNKCLAKTKK